MCKKTQDTEDTGKRYEMALLAMRDGRLDEALDICQALEDEGLAGKDVFFLMFQILMKMGDMEGCRGALKKILSIDPNDINALTNLAVLDGAEGKYQEALEGFKKVLEKDPDNNYIRYNIGVTLIKMGKTKEGIDTLKGIDGELGGDFRVPITIGEALDADGKHREAIDVYDGILSEDPGNVDARTHKALSMNLLHMNSEADEILEGVIKDDPENVEALSMLAVGLYQRGEYRKALPYIEDVIYLEGNKPQRNHMLMSIMRDMRFESIKKIHEENKK